MEFQSYLTFLQQLRQDLDTLTGVEQRKIAAVQAGNLAELDVCMKQEQAAALSLRGKERHRQELLASLGLEHLSLGELPQHCPAQDKRQTAELVEQVQRSYQVLSSAQQAARTLMESKLRHIQQELDRREQAHEARPPVSGQTQTDFRV